MSAIEQILNEDILTAFFQKGSEIAFKNGNLQIVDEEFYEILNGFTLQILYDLRRPFERNSFLVSRSRRAGWNF